MKNKLYLLAGLTILMGFTSCEDFLQKDPLSSPSQSVFWQKKSDFDSALAGCYSIFYSVPGEMSQTIACFDNLTDNSICQHDEETYGKSKTIALGDLTPNTSGFVTNMYAHCYQGIARVQILLENLEKYSGTDMSDSDRKFIVAQCKALRGYFYSWLYLCYKEVPLVTEVLNTDNMYREKSSRPELYQQIMKDYDEAIDQLPDKLYSDEETSGRFTVSTVKALKARILLNDAYDEKGNATDKEKLKEVVSLLESISGYSLAKSMRDNFIRDNQLTSPEIMFSVRYLKPNILNSIDLYYGSWGTNMVSRNLVDEFECTDGQKWGESPLTEKINEELLLQGSTPEATEERAKLFKNRDPRLVQTITHSDKLIFPDAGFENVSQTSSTQTDFGMVKLVQPTKELIGYSTISDQDVIILRYAEVLLMIAEAENELNGPTQKVYNAVNAVRKRSQMPELPKGLSQDDMRERIRHEWRVEFAFEGHRYFQLKRWKLMEKLVNGLVDPALPTYKKVFKPEFYYWPIPQIEIDKANGILTQDPNYL